MNVNAMIEKAMEALRRKARTRVYGQFVKNGNGHGCSQSYWYTLSMQYLETPMFTDAERQEINATVNSIVNSQRLPYNAPQHYKDQQMPIEVNHGCIEVAFCCSCCKQEFLVTYEAGPTGTHETHGHYQNKLKYTHFKGVRMSYYELQSDFKKMWSDYNLQNKNCQNWAYDFFFSTKRGYVISGVAHAEGLTTPPVSVDKDDPKKIRIRGGVTIYDDVNMPDGTLYIGG